MPQGRPGESCTRCRERHFKCVIEPGQRVCKKCRSADKKCQIPERVRFKHVAYVDNPSRGSSTRTYLDYAHDQEWVTSKEPLQFVLEDGLADSDLIAHKSDAAFLEDHKVSSGNESRRDANFEGCGREHLTIENSGPHVDQDSLAPASSWQTLATVRHDDVVARLDIWSPSSIVELSRRYEGVPDGPFTVSQLATPGKDATSPAVSLPTPGVSPLPALSHREAFLLHHYVQKIAPWVCFLDVVLAQY